MKKLGLVAIVIAKNGNKNLVKEELKKLIPLTRKEKGNIKYDLFIDNKNENRFLLQEDWENYDVWQLHMNSEHIKRYNEATKEVIESLELIELTQII